MHGFCGTDMLPFIPLALCSTLYKPLWQARMCLSMLWMSIFPSAHFNQNYQTEKGRTSRGSNHWHTGLVVWGLTTELYSATIRLVIWVFLLMSDIYSWNSLGQICWRQCILCKVGQAHLNCFMSTMPSHLAASADYIMLHTMPSAEYIQLSHWKVAWAYIFNNLISYSSLLHCESEKYLA